MDLQAWHQTAEPGDQITYFKGTICNKPKTHPVKVAAQLLARQGKACLVQRRIGKNSFEYIAIKTKYNDARLTWPEYATTGNKKPVTR